MIDDRVRAVLARLEAEDADERAAGVPAEQRSLAVGPASGAVLFALAAGRPGCRVLEIGGSRGYSTVWLAAAARLAGGSVVSLERDPVKCEAWRRTVADAGLAGHATLVEGDALERLPELDGDADVVFLDAWKDDYETYVGLVRPRLRPGAVLVADNVTSHEALAMYTEARQADPGLVSVTVPTGSGLEVSVVV